MKKPFLALALLALGFVLFATATGCANHAALIRALKDDNAHVRGRVTSLYGTIEFERQMDFAPFPPPAAAAAPPEPPAPGKRRSPRPVPAAPAATDLDVPTGQLAR